MIQDKSTQVHFKVSPRVIFQLGESLISDEIQALVEIIKNSYDADASFVKIEIDSSENNEIIITDNGKGMNYEELISSWLHIANSSKRTQRLENRLTEKNRMPLGDKGLGRLGLQIIGSDLYIETKAENDSTYNLSINWNDFRNARDLNDVPISIKSGGILQKKGTYIRISNLINPNIWKEETAKKKLKNEFSKMISPYKEIRKFIVVLELNGSPIDLVELPEKILDISDIKYDIDFDNNKLVCNAKISKNWFFNKLRVSELDQKEFSSELHLEEFYKYMQNFPNFKQYNLERSLDDNFFCEYSFEKDLIDIDEIEFLERDLFNNKEIANPGSFKGKIDYFDFSFDVGKIDIFDKKIDYTEAVKSIGGIRVFRDGFGIKVDKDWLDLGSVATSKNYYGLRPSNTHGYISISALNNARLEETTSREKFIDNAYYRNFKKILISFVNFADSTNTFFGRKWVDYRKKFREEISKNQLGDTSNVKYVISNKIGNIKEQKYDIKIFEETIKKELVKSVSKVNEIKKIYESDKLDPEVINHSIEDLKITINTLQNIILNAEGTLPKLTKHFDELEKLEKFAIVIEDRFDTINTQLMDMFESVSLGITAESLSHEIYNITDQMYNRTKSIKQKLDASDLIIQNYTEYIISSTLALRKQISYLDPSLKYVKEEKEVFTLKTFFLEFMDYQTIKLSKNNININIKISEYPKYVKVNKGKLIQVFDNLILNSEYWLNRNKDLKEKIINIELNDNLEIYIYDNNIGIDPSVEFTLFEPFVSTKYDYNLKQKGRGLGLFIVKKLLQYENCNIELLPERNQYDRLFKFKIKLKGISNE